MSDHIKRLFLAYQAELQAYLIKIVGSAELAADLTHDTFLKYSEMVEAGSADAVTHERSYLYSTARNLAIDHMRRQARQKTDAVSDTILFEIPDPIPTPEQTVQDRDQLDRVRSALLELPDLTQQVFVLARIEGYKYREIAKTLSVSESSVQKHLARATTHVMRSLRR